MLATFSGKGEKLFRILHDLGVNDQLPDVIAILCRLVLRRCLLGNKHNFALLAFALLDRPHDLGPDRIVVSLAEFKDHFLTILIEARDLDKVIRLGITLANVAVGVLVLLDHTLLQELMTRGHELSVLVRESHLQLAGDLGGSVLAGLGLLGLLSDVARHLTFGLENPHPVLESGGFLWLQATSRVSGRPEITNRHVVVAITHLWYVRS